MEQILKQILLEVQGLSKRIDNLEGDMTSMKDDITFMKSDMATKIQQDESIGFIQALISRTDIIDAKLDGLVVNTASKEAVAKLDAKLNVLNDRLFNQEADIQLLKKAQ